MSKKSLKAQSLLFGPRRSFGQGKEIICRRQPSVVALDGSRQWLDRAGRPHRLGGPALLLADGTEEWYKEGKLHRRGGPALRGSDGREEWYQNGQLHRDNGPARLCSDGTEEWYKGGQLHREDGPAVEEADGSEEWYKDGQLHRDDGPAMVRYTGSGWRQEWWLLGQRQRVEYSDKACG